MLVAHASGNIAIRTLLIVRRWCGRSTYTLSSRTAAAAHRSTNAAYSQLTQRPPLASGQGVHAQSKTIQAAVTVPKYTSQWNRPHAIRDDSPFAAELVAVAEGNGDV
jgi:hypothetical protein